MARALSTGAGLFGLALLLLAFLIPPLVLIFILYVIVAPRVLEANGIIDSKWRRGDDESGGGSGGG